MENNDTPDYKLACEMHLKTIETQARIIQSYQATQPQAAIQATNGVTVDDLSYVIQWLCAGCDPMKAADELMIFRSRLAAPAPTVAAPSDCLHDDTVRQGAIWTACNQCGKRWADDEVAAPTGASQSEPNLTECRHCGFYVALNREPAPAPAIQAQPLTDTAIGEIAFKYDLSKAMVKSITKDIERHVSGQTGGADHG